MFMIIILLFFIRNHKILLDLILYSGGDICNASCLFQIMIKTACVDDMHLIPVPSHPICIAIEDIFKSSEH